MRRLIATIICAAASLFAGAAAAQQDFPTKPIRLIVPFPPGGAVDTVARQLANGIGGILKQSVVVENVTGAGGAIGMSQVVRAQPDGYTWGVAVAGTLSILPLTQNPSPYDPLKDMALVTLVAKITGILIASPDLPANDFKSLVALLKAKPGNFASAGAGSISHLAGELFKHDAGLSITHVPYKGAVPAMTDIMGGRVQIGMLDVGLVLQQVQAGKLKAMAVTSDERVPVLPDVPTMKELGFPRVNSNNWFGLVGNANIPIEIQQRMRNAAIETLKQPAVVAELAKFVAVPAFSTPAEFRELVQADQAKWGEVIKSIGYKE